MSDVTPTETDADRAISLMVELGFSAAKLESQLTPFSIIKRYLATARSEGYEAGRASLLPEPGGVTYYDASRANAGGPWVLGAPISAWTPVTISSDELIRLINNPMPTPCTDAPCDVEPAVTYSPVRVYDPSSDRVTKSDFETLLKAGPVIPSEPAERIPPVITPKAYDPFRPSTWGL